MSQCKSFDKLEFRQKVTELIIKIQGGETSAKDDLATLLLPYMKMIGLPICRDASELASNANIVLAKAINNIHNINTSKNPLTYITNSMRNYCIDQFRKTKVLKRTPPAFQEPKVLPDVEPSMEFLIEDLCKNETDKLIVSKIIFEKQPVVKISKELQMSPSAIRKRLGKLRKALKDSD